MPKYTPHDVRLIAERLKDAKDSLQPAHFLIGAGCSISAGIPGAAKLIEQIHNTFPALCENLKPDDRHSYGACMAILAPNQRRKIIIPHLTGAKINWGHIALAQLIAQDFIGRVLTLNFDLVLENACGLLGLQPAVYDFGVAPANDPAMVVSPAIVHLHGQSYGLVLLNDEEETEKHREKLSPILTDTLWNAPLVIIGYSGSSDGIFQNILNDTQYRDTIHWIAYEEDPPPHVRALIEKKQKQRRFVGGADFDRFMIDLVQALGCWPPRLFNDPLAHLLDGLHPIVPYPIGDPGSELDLLSNLRNKLQGWQGTLQQVKLPFDRIRQAFMKGDYDNAVDLFQALPADVKGGLPDDDRDVAAWSLIMSGNRISEKAKSAKGDEAKDLFAAAAAKYAQALELKANSYAALNNWGSLLATQARRAPDGDADPLFDAANEKYSRALAIEPDRHDALYNWGNMLLAQAKRTTGEKATQLFAQAGDKYARALVIKPDRHEALANWGNLLSAQAERAGGADAAQLFAKAQEKFAQALALKPDSHEVLSNCAAALMKQARISEGPERDRLFAEARQKLEAAAKIKPGQTYNLACIAALEGKLDEARAYLEQAKAHNALPDAQYLRTDSDLANLRNEPWFQKMIA